MANQNIFQKIRYDDIEGVKSLINEHPDKINEGNEDGQTPLMHACGFGTTRMTKLLLDAGANVNKKENRNGFTALHFAVDKGHYDVVALLLSQDSVELELRDYKKRTPLLEAAASGHLGIIHKLISVGANVNAVDNENNSSLHLVLKRDVFDSEGAPMDILYECCSDLNLEKKEWLSCGVVARYLARQGANFYCKNNYNDTPLDLIMDQNLIKKFQTFLPPQCLWCNIKEATERFYPCKHLAICKSCSNVQLKQCLKCGKALTSRSEVGSLACVGEVLTMSQQSESPELTEKDLLRVAKRLGSNWWQVAVFLGIETSEQDINDESIDAVKRGYMMLYEWFSNCDPETRTRATLSAALEEAECFTAFEYLSSGEK